VNAQQFLEKHGREGAQAFCDKVGTSLAYFLQVAEGKRTVSRNTAARWELESGGEMDRVSLVFGSNPPPPVEVVVAANEPLDEEGGHAAS
jgi:hypothetical protein